ncbi:hypothetical protein Thermus77927_24790 [Thermus hydrothermalis]
MMGWVYVVAQGLRALLYWQAANYLASAHHAYMASDRAAALVGASSGLPVEVRPILVGLREALWFVLKGSPDIPQEPERAKALLYMSDLYGVLGEAIGEG